MAEGLRRVRQLVQGETARAGWDSSITIGCAAVKTDRVSMQKKQNILLLLQNSVQLLAI